VRSVLLRAYVLTVILGIPAVSLADQEDDQPAQHHHESNPPAAAAGWSWTSSANIIFGYNYQSRKYADFSAWESQNWFMLTSQRATEQGRLTFQTMLSLEPFTIHAQGSPQLYQTGESYQQVPLVNYQHPHDLLMELGATYRLQLPAVAYVFGADLVGSPTLGPTPFMHRESAEHNPQVPLTHHSLDSTHITWGVVRFGVDTGRLTLEASAFRGEEPDENRLNIEAPRLNSWAARIGWRQGPWQAQFSGGWLHEPEWFEPYDTTRWTASVAYDGAIRSRVLHATLAWGQNRYANGFNDKDNGYLLEWDFRTTPTTSLYGRAEFMTKQIFGLGFHPRGFGHPHFYSHIDALTLGYIKDLPMGPIARAMRGPIGVGADISAYRTSPELTDLYEGSRSFHVFLRWRPTSGSGGGHVHVH
jgi:hypothetical protein